MTTQIHPEGQSKEAAKQPAKQPPKERSVPKPVFTDAEAGAREFPSSESRTFTYFTPQKRRASVYEDVTVDVQPDPERYLSQGWIYGFANGPGGYPKEWTALKSSNWHEFRDPNEEWEQTIYRNGANSVRQVSQNLANAKAEHSFKSWNRAWIKAVERHIGAWAHAENGIGLHVYTRAQRDAPTNMINNALAVAAAHKIRFAQDLILYNLDISEELEGFDGKAHQAAWQDDPVWQGVRENVERLTGTRDWAEAFFATAIVFEPLVGELFRSNFVMQCAALQGDFVTPALMGVGEADAHREERGARQLFEMLLNDPEYGGENRAQLQDWLAVWAPHSIKAARQLQPVWSQVSEKVVTFEDSLDRAKARFGDLLGALGLESQKEL
jgi:propane monooxygenase small subunit